MPRHIYKFLLIGLLLLLAVVPTETAKASDQVTVRIPIEAGMKLDRSAIQADKIIDYGSFLWAVMNSQDLAALDKSGTEYQTIENPYTLTLGGQSFDPLVNSPSFSATLSAKEKSGSAGLHLVQFHGPIKDEWLADLEAAGLEIIQYIHPFTYVVWGETTSLDRSRSQEAVRWAGDYLPAYAVLPENRALNSDPILVRSVTLPQAGLERTLAEIEALGGSLVGSASDVDPVFDLATFLLPGNQLTTAAALTGIYSISPVPMDGGDRGEMSNQINVGNYDGANIAFTGYGDWLSSVGLSGDGVIIANVDSGVDQNHPDLVNRFIACTGTTCGNAALGEHGTHTAGIMAGDGSSGVVDTFGFLRGLGMAPGAHLVEQVYSPTYTYEDGMLTLMTQSYNNGAVVSGNSWGPSGIAQGYDEDTRLVDVGVRDADPDTAGNQQLNYILSIMNGYGGISSQGTPDEAKNTFTVGSTVMQQSSGAQYTNINDLSNTSAHGPALDGRTIPHMVAPGCYVDSTGLSSGYVLKCGTSMASPQVTGSVALFIEYYRQLFSVDPSPALVKAAFLPVAHDLSGNLDADGGTLGHPFDSKQGWGRLNTDAVVNPLTNTTVLYFDQETVFDNSGETWTYTFNDVGFRYDIRAMLVWTDAPGTPTGGTTPAWVNDLDLSITIGSDTYLGNNFGTNGLSATGGSSDEINNTEGVFLNDQPADSITFTVSATNIAGDGVPNTGDGTDQDFALVIYLAYIDSDGDGMPDYWENEKGLDPNNPDDADDDPDSDGLTNLGEYINGTDLYNPDSDDDNMPDGWEVDNGLNPNDPNDSDNDPDNDGLTNLEEFTEDTDPNNPDSDYDGMLDSWEVDNGLNPNDPNDADYDPDEDGLTNLEEFNENTDPHNPDSDDDGMPDGWEVDNDLDPNNPNDAGDDPDGDDKTNLEEYMLGTDPNQFTYFYFFALFF